MDNFLSSLAQLLSASELICSQFRFFGQLETLSLEEIQGAATILIKNYNYDLDQYLGIVLILFVEFSKMFKGEEVDDKSKEQLLYKLVIDKRVEDAFPDVERALCMYLVLMVTNCSAEHSFSKMNPMKKRLCTAMTQDRLNELALMNVEYHI